MSEETNPREELYQRFRKSLSRPVSERFFDEDELVEIYDYAGDISDDYVQFEALFCGARLYPESIPLSERRALLYLDTSVDDSDAPSPAAGEYLNDNAEHFSPIFDIARLEVNRPEDPEAALEYLLNQYDVFNDEEIIRFVNLAFDLDRYAWVTENLDRLRKKVSFQPVLVYEVMQEADEQLDNDLMGRLAEELIESEPFSVQYWVTLFKAQARGGKEEEAKSSFDYARALGADDHDSLMALADNAYNFAPYLYSEAYDIIEGLKSEHPDDFLYTDCQCAILARAGASDRAITLLKDYATAHPEDPKALRQLLMCNIPDAAKYVQRFAQTANWEGIDEDFFVEMLNTLSVNSASRSVVALLDEYSKSHELQPVDFNTWVEALFAMGKFQRIVDLIDDYTSTEEGHVNFISLVLGVPLRGVATSFAYMVSLMKLHRQADAEAHYTEIRPMVEHLISEAPMPVRMCARNLQTLVDKIRQHGDDDTLYWEYFDMLSYSKLYR